MSGQKTQTSPQFPKYASKNMRFASKQARNLYEDPSTEMIPELNRWTTQGIDNRAAIATGGNTVAGAGVDEARKILSGGYLDVTQDPRFQRNINSALGMTADRFAGSGRTGSGAYAGAMSDAATGVAAQMYDAERQRQMGALGMMPELIRANYADAAALEDAGRALDEDKMARFDWPYARLDRMANTIYGSPAAQMPGQKSESPFNWTSAILGAVNPISNFGGK